MFGPHCRVDFNQINNKQMLASPQSLHQESRNLPGHCSKSLCDAKAYSFQQIHSLPFSPLIIPLLQRYFWNAFNQKLCLLCVEWYLLTADSNLFFTVEKGHLIFFCLWSLLFPLEILLYRCSCPPGTSPFRCTSFIFVKQWVSFMSYILLTCGYKALNGVISGCDAVSVL